MTSVTWDVYDVTWTSKGSKGYLAGYNEWFLLTCQSLAKISSNPTLRVWLPTVNVAQASNQASAQDGLWILGWDAEHTHQYGEHRRKEKRREKDTKQERKRKKTNKNRRKERIQLNFLPYSNFFFFRKPPLITGSHCPENMNRAYYLTVLSFYLQISKVVTNKFLYQAKYCTQYIESVGHLMKYVY